MFPVAAVHVVWLVVLAVFYVVALGLLVFDIVLGGAYRRHRARPLDAIEAIDVDGAAVDVFREMADAASVVRAAGQLFDDSERWVHRRVEHIELTGARTARRRVSIDFHVPTDTFVVSPGALAALAGEAAAASSPAVEPTPEDKAAAEKKQYRLVPLSLLRSWPPVFRFDLLDPSGKSMTLLSKSTTNYLDLLLLRDIAKEALGTERAQLIDPWLTNVTHAEGQRSADAVVAIIEVVGKLLADNDIEPLREPAAERLMALCQALSSTTLLWVAVEGTTADRVLVKLAYDEPLNRRLVWWRRPFTALGWLPEVTHIQVPHIGMGGSYHLQLEVPPPVNVYRARLSTKQDPTYTPEERKALRRRRRTYRLARRYSELLAWLPAPVPDIEQTDRLNRVLPSAAHLYRSGGERDGRPGMAEMQLFVSRRSQPTANLLISFLVSLLLFALAARFPTLTAPKAVGSAAFSGAGSTAAFGSLVGFLLLAPGLLAWVYSRSGEHPFVTRMLSGSRLLAFVSLMLPVVAAAFLIDARASGSAGTARTAVSVLRDISYGPLASQFISWMLPLRPRRYRRD